jgi:hypothetical protein
VPSKFDKCIDIAFKAGKITKDIAERIKAADDPELAIDSVLTDLSRQKREAAIQAVRLSQAWDNIKTHPNGAYEGLISLLTKDPKGKAGYFNVEYLGKFYEGKYDSMLAEALSVFRTRNIGFSQDEAGLRNLVRAIYGEAVDDPQIMKFAKQWADVTETIRTDFNAKGGSISKNEKWLMPQNHDARELLAKGKTELESKALWKEKITPMLDRNNMLDDNGNQLTDEAFDEALDFTFETIVSGGLNKTKDFTVPRMGAKLSRKGSERRFLFFKDADSWLEYQKVYGKGDIFTTLTDHVSSKANDIANMEIFGTSPKSTFDALLNQVKKEGEIKPRQGRFAEMVFDVATGRINQGELTTLADFMQSVRNVITASTLGKAFLSAFSDIGFQAITARYNNLPALKVLNKQMSLMNPANEADRIAAVKMGLIAEAWKGRATGANRYADVYGTDATQKMAEGVMRASLLAPWTDAGRKAFGMEYSSMLADNFTIKFNDLDPSTKKAFASYGISEQDWDVFRAQKPLTHKGAKFADMTQDGGKKFHQMVLSETDFAVPTPDSRVRAFTTGGLGRASIAGQAWRSAMMLKSFPITIMTTHFYRAAMQSTIGEKLSYVGLLAASTSALGGAALQMKDIAAGREPRPVDEKFVGAAFMQGGGLGILGDFVFSDKNRFGGGIEQTLAGPTGELFNKVTSLTLGNVQQAFKGEETNVLSESIQFIDRYTPDIWQTHLFKNAIFDQLELMSDPKAQKKFNRIMKKRKKEFNQDYWWKKGQTLPEEIK